MHFQISKQPGASDNAFSLLEREPVTHLAFCGLDLSEYCVTGYIQTSLYTFN